MIIKIKHAGEEWRVAQKLEVIIMDRVSVGGKGKQTEGTKRKDR